MATNQRIQYDINDLPYEQLAQSKVSQTDFTPGKANALPLDENWPTHFRVPVGTPNFEEDVAGPVEVTRVRIIKIGRNVVSDQAIAAPEADTPVVTTITDTTVWGAVAPTHTITPTDTQESDGVQEKTSGYDWAEGA